MNSFLIIYTPNLTSLFLIIVRKMKDLEKKFKIDIINFNGEVYKIKLISNEGLEITIKCLEKTIPNFYKILELEEEGCWKSKSGKVEDREIKIKEIQKKIDNDIVKIDMLLKKIKETFNKELKEWERSCMSLPAIAVKLFKKKFNKNKIKIKTCTTLTNIIKEAHFGGRCEVLGNPIEGEIIHHYDFKNMFGNIMREEFNTSELRFEGNCKFDEEGFYYIEGFSNIKDLPVLPMRNEEPEGVIYANGFLEGLYWHEEIKLFLEEGGEIEKIHFAIKFRGKKKKNIFKKFAEYCMEKRDEGDIEKKIWKKILVSLYGRLGMGVQKKKTIVVNINEYDEIRKKKINIEKEQWYGEVALIEIIKDKEETETELKSKVIYASIIASKARIKLYKTIKKVMEDGGRVYYYDTDSVFAGFKKNMLNELSGEIKWEERLDWAVFAGTRTYATVAKGREEVKIAGLPRNSLPIERFYFDFYQNRPLSGIRDIDNKKTKNIYENTERKILCLNSYNKRVFSNSKRKTTPIFLEKKK